MLCCGHYFKLFAAYSALPRFNSSGMVKVTVLPGELVARIEGGDRVVNNGAELVFAGALGR